MTDGPLPLDSRVAHFFSRMDPGGAELRTIEVVRRTGAAFDFVAVSGAAGSLDSALQGEGHSVHLLRLALRNFGAFVSLMRRRRYRVVHSHLGLASGPVLMLAWLARVPKRIAHFRSDGVGGQRSKRKDLSLWLSKRLVGIFATHIVGVSPGSLSHGWRRNWMHDRRCQVIPNGFDASRLRGDVDAPRNGSDRRVEDRGLVVVNVGRADPVKNRGRSVEIWAGIAAITRSQLYMVGALNEEDARTVSFIRARLSSGSIIEVIGETTDVASYTRSADVLLATSTREGLPGVVLEALAVGTPVVATKLPGAEWIASILPGIHLCALGDEDSEWASAVQIMSDFSRDDIMDAFDQGPFTINSADMAFRRLWGLAT